MAHLLKQVIGGIQDLPNRNPDEIPGHMKYGCALGWKHKGAGIQIWWHTLLYSPTKDIYNYIINEYI